MPSRPICVTILLVWVYAAGALLRRDVLPDYWTTPAPDLRSMASAGDDSGPTGWDLSVADGNGQQSFRSVGSASTYSRRTPDGGTELVGEVSFDSGDMLKGTLLALKSDGAHIQINNVCDIDPQGNLRGFRAEVKVLDANEPEPLLSLVGKVVDHSIVVKTQGPIPLLNGTRTFPYEPRGMIQNGVGPIDRLPGLQIGQRWETRVVNPINGRVDTVKTEVTGKHMIQWDNKVETTLEVVQRMAPISARTWVKRDGTVLRQEIPLPFVKLILERKPPKFGGRGQDGVKAP